MRGSGTTTRQIKDAPHGAYYVWVNYATSYPKKLAEKLGRTDLVFIGPDNIFEKLVGTEKQVVVDHATALKSPDRLALLNHQDRLRMRGIIK
jgi:hypothetical protein